MEIKRIPPQTVPLFSPDGNHLGDLNEYELLEFRCQIAESNAEGYFIEYNEEFIHINSNGSIPKWPTGLFDTMESLFSRLFKAQRNASISRNIP
jgi:hypothetical protein